MNKAASFWVTSRLALHSVLSFISIYSLFFIFIIVVVVVVIDYGTCHRSDIVLKTSASYDATCKNATLRLSCIKRSSTVCVSSYTIRLPVLAQSGIRLQECLSTPFVSTVVACLWISQSRPIPSRCCSYRLSCRASPRCSDPFSRISREHASRSILNKLHRVIVVAAVAVVAVSPSRR